MRAKKFSVSAWAASLIGSLLGAVIMAPSNWPLDSSKSRVIWAGAFFLVVFLCGFLGLQLALRLSRKYKVALRRNWIIALLLAGVMLFGLGAGGQALFMYSKETVFIPAEVDMVMLLDASGSMDAEGYSIPRTNAACQFVDSLGSTNNLQAISFAATVLNSSPLSVMDDAGKQSLKEFIQSIDSTGNTFFNAPLKEALRTLQTNGRESANKAVILLTDGLPLDWNEGIPSDIINGYLSSNVKIFSIRISKLTVLDPRAQALADFAISTGGSDTQLIPNADGSIDAADMLAAFQNAFQATSETKVNMKNDLLVCSDGATAWQILVRAVTMMLCAIVFGFGYFGKIHIKTMLLNILMGFILAGLVTLLGGVGYSICAPLLCLMMAAAYVSINFSMGEEIDV